MDEHTQIMFDCSGWVIECENPLEIYNKDMEFNGEELEINAICIN